MTEFKAGDKVYILLGGYPPKIYPLVECIHSEKHPLGLISTLDTFTKDGKFTVDSAIPSLVLATQENYEMLCKLFPDTPWEEPHKKPTPREIVERMLEDGWKSVPCYVKDNERNAPVRRLIEEVTLGRYSPYYDGMFEWRFCKPYDPKTDKVIVDYVDGEVILES